MFGFTTLSPGRALRVSSARGTVTRLRAAACGGLRRAAGAHSGHDINRCGRRSSGTRPLLSAAAAERRPHHHRRPFVLHRLGHPRHPLRPLHLHPPPLPPPTHSHLHLPPHRQPPLPSPAPP